MAYSGVSERLLARIRAFIEENWVPEGPALPEEYGHTMAAADMMPDYMPNAADDLEMFDLDFGEAFADAPAEAAYGDFDFDADFDAAMPYSIEAPPPPSPAPAPPAAMERRKAAGRKTEAEKAKKTGLKFSVGRRRKAAQPPKEDRPASPAPAANIMGLHLAEEEEAFPEDYAPTAAPHFAADAMPMYSAYEAVAGSFDPDAGFKLEESFPQAVLRLIDEKGMTDPQCYNRANLSRAVFNKLKQSALNPEASEYRPSKETALALTMGLALTLDEAKALLEKAGFALSHCSKRDLIVEYFLMIGNHDIFELNDALFRFQQQPLGSF